MPATNPAKRKTTVLPPQRVSTGAKLPPTRSPKKVAAPGGTPCTPPLKGGVLGVHQPAPAGRNDEERIKALLAEVQTLSGTGRRKLLDELSLATLAAVKPDERDLQMWARSVAEALSGLTTDTPGGSYGVTLVRRSLATAACWQPVHDFCQEVGFERLDMPSRQRAYDLLATILLRHVSSVSARSGAPVVLKLVANCVPQVRALFDQQFPGYLASRIALLPFRQHAAHGFTNKSWSDD